MGNAALVTDFLGSFGHQPTVFSKAPGRVNLIGEHTDYNNGYVLPAAINYYTSIAASSRVDRELHLVAKNFGTQKSIIYLDREITSDSQAPWSNYVRGLVIELKKRGFKLAGGNLLISGNVPAGAGLSSSASLEMAVIGALLSLSGETIDPVQAALAGQAAENNFVGCNCGIMDQLISACGEDQCALLIDCENLQTRSVKIPDGLEILIVHSGVKRGLVESEYNLRRTQCETAAKFFGKKSLREVTQEQLFAAEKELDPVCFKRARHVLTENARTLSAAEALNRGDLAHLFKVMGESHNSMRDDFEITVPAIDKLVQILQTAGAGQAGARMTGGGFGGCVVALAPAEIIPQLSAAVEAEYKAQTGCEPTLISAKASAGAFFVADILVQ